MSLDFVPTGIATGISGTLMGTEVVTTIAAAGRYIVPAGVYYLYAVGANCQLQVLNSAGVWQNVFAAGVGGLIASEGTNVGVVNNGAGNQTVTTQKLG